VAGREDITELLINTHVNHVPLKMDVDTFVIANEFFDALPIHIFEVGGDGHSTLQILILVDP
jgi:SAM-dependent MidA family methyltransferase